MLTDSWTREGEEHALYRKVGDEYQRAWPLGGTSLKGYVSATFGEMVKLFGKPEYGCGKATHEWVLINKHSARLCASIYNYKETSDWLDADERRESNHGFISPSAWAKRHKEKRYEWHIGAHTSDIAESAIKFIQDRLEALREEAADGS